MSELRANGLDARAASTKAALDATGGDGALSSTASSGRGHRQRAASILDFGLLTFYVALLGVSGLSLVYMRPYISGPSLKAVLHAFLVFTSERPLAALVMSHAVFGSAVLIFLLWLWGKRPVYLVDFYCFRPPNHLAGTIEDVIRGAEITELFNEQGMTFIKKILEMSGLSQSTFFPQEVRNAGFDKYKPTFEGQRKETELALFVCIEKVLAATNVKAQEIDALIVNCCNWTPVPSLASAVVNHFKLKSSILSFTFSGMGCTATVIAAGMAAEMLQNHRNMRVLIASTENIGAGMYRGQTKGCMITNLIFRYGGVAFLMSNCMADKRKAKYQLSHIVRTHLGADDAAYRCVYQQADDSGNVGVKIGRELMDVAGRAMKVNIRTLAPLILPASEKLKYVFNLFERKVLGKRISEYAPDFTTAIEHFCIHTGGKPVLDAVQKALKFSNEQGEPCRATFHQYGNTSAASTWYNWAFVETRQGVKRGDRVWQLSFGSGFKCCSAVWRSLRPVSTQHDAWTGTPSCPASACYPESTIPERYHAPGYKPEP